MRASNMLRSPVALVAVELAGVAACHDPSVSNSGTTATETACATDECATGSTIDGTTVDASSSTGGPQAICGNGAVEPPEQCDGAPLHGTPCPETCRFEPGTVLWETRFDWEGGSDQPLCAALDGHALVVGGITGSATGGPDGGPGGGPLLLWLPPEGDVSQSLVLQPDPPLELRPFAADHVHADEQGLVVTGRGLASDDSWLARFSHEGELQWLVGYSAMDPESPTNVSDAITLADGRIALVAWLDLGGTNPGRIAYFDDGVLVDEESFGGPLYSPASPGLTNFGLVRAAPLIEPEILLYGSASLDQVKHPWMQRRRFGAAPDDHLWEVMLDSPPGELLDRFVDASVRADGSIVMLAYRTLAPDERRDMWVGAFAPTGEPLWSDTYIGEYHSDDVPAGVATDASGNVYVHHTLSDANHPQTEANHDFILIAYDADGTRRWLDRWTGPGDGNGLMSWDYASRVVVDPDGFILATGKTYSGDDDYDVIVRKLAP